MMNHEDNDADYDDEMMIMMMMKKTIALTMMIAKIPNLINTYVSTVHSSAVFLAIVSNFNRT